MVRLFRDWRRRTKWEDGLIWFRLRYLAPPTRALKLLSRPDACGRIGLYFLPGEPVSRLYLGLSPEHTRLLRRMAADFSFWLSPKPAAVTLPAAQAMTAVAELPWDRAFAAHIAGEAAFVGGPKLGRYLPQPPGPTTWQLPAEPPPGLSLVPVWNGTIRPDSTSLLLTPGRVNVYGRTERVADWLLRQVTQAVGAGVSNLVVVDGRGDLGPRLKRKSAVTKRLGKDLDYLDLDIPALSGGFNPLAAFPEETASQLLCRWQQWFGGMNTPRPAIELLALARQDGVGDIPALRDWLKQADRAGRPPAAALLLALGRLTADRQLKAWLDWPVNRFGVLPDGVLFFTCRDSGWAQRQLLRAVLLGVSQSKGVRLVVHGIAWEAMALPASASIVLSNGPRLSGSRLVVTGCHARGAAVLAERFFGGDATLQENLELLGPGQALVVEAGRWDLVLEGQGAEKGDNAG